MESFFVVFDRENKQMGFAQTTCPPPYPGSRRSEQAIDRLHSAPGGSLLSSVSCRHSLFTAVSVD